MDEVEAQLSSEDHGKDIISVSNLLKKHQVRLAAWLHLRLRFTLQSARSVLSFVLLYPLFDHFHRHLVTFYSCFVIAK